MRPAQAAGCLATTAKEHGHRQHLIARHRHRDAGNKPVTGGNMFKRTTLSTAIAWALGGLTGLHLVAAHAAETTQQPQTPAEQQADSAPTLAKVTVTAQKREETVQEVPSSISVLNGDKVRDTSLQSANEVTRFIPN